ncbi:MAG: hypothetical protein V1701_08550 [Planctomycetota bacterium]
MPKKEIVSKVLLLVPLGLDKVPEHMAEQWARTQKNVMDITESKRAKIIPNEKAYIEKLAETSAAQFAKFISPTYISKKGKNRDAIVTQQSHNISRGYKKYKASLDYLTAEVDGEFAKRMKERVDIKKNIYSQRMAEVSLPFTGETTIGKGVCGIAPHWLVGDSKIVGHLAGAQVTGGGPVNIARCDDEIDLRSALKAGLSSQLLKSGRVIVTSEFQKNTIRKENNNINALIRGLQDTVKYAPFETGGDSHCDYVMDGPTMYLEIQVTEVIP